MPFLQVLWWLGSCGRNGRKSKRKVGMLWRVCELPDRGPPAPTPPPTSSMFILREMVPSISSMFSSPFRVLVS